MTTAEANERELLEMEWFEQQQDQVGFDYTNQAWVVGGLYERCGHAESMACGCFGCAHAGHTADLDGGSGCAGCRVERVPLVRDSIVSALKAVA